MLYLSKQQARRIIKANYLKSYTYGLCRTDGSLYYVGVGIRNRVFQHLTKKFNEQCGNKLKVNTTNKVGIDSVLIVLFAFDSNREQCLELEKKLISKFGRIDNGTGVLTNLTDGGEIGPTGVKISAETRIKLSAARHKSRDELSQKNKAYWTNLSDEEKQAIVTKMHSKRADPSELSAKLKERWADPEYKRKLSETQKEAQRKAAALHSENMRKRWANPEYREAMRLARLAKKSKEAILPEPKDNLEK